MRPLRNRTSFEKMKRSPVTPQDLNGVIAVPSLPRRSDDPRRAPDFAEARRLVDRIAGAGITRFMFGGNAFFQHITLREYAAALEWMAGLPDSWWVLPSAGPSYGRLMDQAEILRGRGFPAVMMLPCSDPRDAAGLEVGLREFADAAGAGIILYLKSEDTFSTDIEAGLDAIGRLCADGTCVGIKYAIVRADPGRDPYLEGLLRRVPRHLVASGIGERPAIVHLRDWGLSGFTTGSGCVAPRWTQTLFELCRSGQWEDAERIRQRFLPLEDRRDASCHRTGWDRENGPRAPFPCSAVDRKAREHQGRVGASPRRRRINGAPVSNT
jgi:dihydrodipicolinate synthase/N-acetylneuraminate lyase